MKIGKIIISCLAITAIIVSLNGMVLNFYELNNTYNTIATPFVIIVIIGLYLYEGGDGIEDGGIKSQTTCIKCLKKLEVK